MIAPTANEHKNFQPEFDFRNNSKNSWNSIILTSFSFGFAPSFRLVQYAEPAHWKCTTLLRIVLGMPLHCFKNNITWLFWSKCIWKKGSVEYFLEKNHDKSTFLNLYLGLFVLQLKRHTRHHLKSLNQLWAIRMLLRSGPNKAFHDIQVNVNVRVDLGENHAERRSAMTLFPNLQNRSNLVILQERIVPSKKNMPSEYQFFPDPSLQSVDLRILRCEMMIKLERRSKSSKNISKNRICFPNGNSLCYFPQQFQWNSFQHWQGLKQRIGSAAG